MHCWTHLWDSVKTQQDKRLKKRSKFGHFDAEILHVISLNSQDTDLFLCLWALSSIWFHYQLVMFISPLPLLLLGCVYIPSCHLKCHNWLPLRNCQSVNTLPHTLPRSQTQTQDCTHTHLSLHPSCLLVCSHDCSSFTPDKSSTEHSCIIFLQHLLTPPGHSFKVFCLCNIK